MYFPSFRYLKLVVLVRTYFYYLFLISFLQLSLDFYFGGGKGGDGIWIAGAVDGYLVPYPQIRQRVLIEHGYGPFFANRQDLGIRRQFDHALIIDELAVFDPARFNSELAAVRIHFRHLRAEGIFLDVQLGRAGNGVIAGAVVPPAQSVDGDRSGGQNDQVPNDDTFNMMVRHA